MATALLIDDDRELLDTIAANAAEEGLSLATASSWEEGIALFHVLSPRLVIADYNLPGSAHGLNLLLELKRLRPSVRVILISGVVNPDELSRVESLGVVDRVISKGSGIAATRQLLEEFRAADSRSQEPTNWRKFAQALVDQRGVDERAVAELDDRLRTRLEREQ